MRSPTNQFNHSQQNAFAIHEHPNDTEVQVEQTSLENYDQEDVGTFMETSFSENDEEKRDRIEVEELIDAEYQELEDNNKMYFQEYNHDQFDIFPEVLKYHRKTLMKEFKKYALDVDDEQLRTASALGEGMSNANAQRKVVELSQPIGVGSRLRLQNWQYWYVINDQRCSFDFVQCILIESRLQQLNLGQTNDDIIYLGNMSVSLFQSAAFFTETPAEHFQLIRSEKNERKRDSNA